MAYFRTLRGLFRRGEKTDINSDAAHAMIFYVRCNRCGEVICVRADRRWDLLQELGDGPGGYTLHKDVLGTRCNELMRMLVRFDASYKITRQEVEGGRFVTQADYETYRSGGQQTPGPA